MVGKIFSCGLSGIHGHVITIEVDVSNGLPAYDTVGLPDKAVSESRERVRSAIRNSGFSLPARRITVNLAPADLRKEGTIYDLPIALGVLSANELIDTERLKQAITIGELALDGSIRSIHGALPMAIMAREQGFQYLICPQENAIEASYVEGIEVVPVSHLSDFCKSLSMKQPFFVQPTLPWQGKQPDSNDDFALIRGQFLAKRAAEIAASGGHNMLLIGAPGAGKTMLARSLPTILPTLTFEEALNITCIYSSAGKMKNASIATKRPFIAPHHSASAISIIGGGAMAKPGAISLAHGGLLFLDEMPEFQRNVLELLRQPLEDGEITVSRAQASETYPAQFMLIGAMNPCPCGYYGSKIKPCICSDYQIKRYRSRLSGPLLDRIDLFVSMEEVKFHDFYDHHMTNIEKSENIRMRVETCRELQRERLKSSKLFSNSQMKQGDIERYCLLDNNAKKMYEIAFSEQNISGRAHARVLRLARTIADLAQQEMIQEEHLAEALQYRSFDKCWG